MEKITKQIADTEEEIKELKDHIKRLKQNKTPKKINIYIASPGN